MDCAGHGLCYPSAVMAVGFTGQGLGWKWNGIAMCWAGFYWAVHGRTWPYAGLALCVAGYDLGLPCRTLNVGFSRRCLGKSGAVLSVCWDGRGLKCPSASLAVGWAFHMMGLPRSGLSMVWAGRVWPGHVLEWPCFSNHRLGCTGHWLVSRRTALAMCWAGLVLVWPGAGLSMG
jgi:hypothetical protein